MPPFLSRVFIFLGLALCVFCLAGCKKNKGGEVSGTLTYGGKPVNGATLKFHPADGSSFPVAVGQDGKFHAKGVPIGELKVTVHGNKGNPGIKGKKDASTMKDNIPKDVNMEEIPPTIPFPEKYSNIKTTELKCTVTGKPQTEEFVLKDS
jgi:hypothetical protein